jgi:hypothetical protein
MNRSNGVLLEHRAPIFFMNKRPQVRFGPRKVTPFELLFLVVLNIVFAYYLKKCILHQYALVMQDHPTQCYTEYIHQNRTRIWMPDLKEV